MTQFAFVNLSQNHLSEPSEDRLRVEPRNDLNGSHHFISRGAVEMGRWLRKLAWLGWTK